MSVTDPGGDYRSRTPEDQGILVPYETCEYTFFAQVLKEAAEKHEHLRLANIPENDPIQILSSLDDLVSIYRYAIQTAREIGIATVREGIISRVQAAQKLGVHQGTIARWVKESEDVTLEREEQMTDILEDPAGLSEEIDKYQLKAHT